MKFLLTEIAALLAISKAGGESFKSLQAKDPESPKHTKRQLTGLDGYNFLVSVRGDENKEEYWCIDSGTSDGNLAHLSKCDFDARPAKQLWLEDYSDFDPDCQDWPWCYGSELEGWQYRLRSASGDQSKCLHVGFGGASVIDDNTRIRVVDCDIESENKYFTSSFPPSNHYFGSSQKFQIHSADSESYCITNQGANPSEGANMIVKTCMNTERFHWVGQPSYRAIWPESGGAGCIGIRDGVATEEAPLEIRDCPSYNYYIDTYDDYLLSEMSQLWAYDNEKGLFHSALRYDKCIMVGYGNVVNVGESKRLRIGDCNEHSPKNQFYWDSWDIKWKGLDYSYNEGYCVTHRGKELYMGDPVIIKDCNTPGDHWRFEWSDRQE